MQAAYSWEPVRKMKTKSFGFGKIIQWQDLGREENSFLHFFQVVMKQNAAIEHLKQKKTMTPAEREENQRYVSLLVWNQPSSFGFRVKLERIKWKANSGILLPKHVTWTLIGRVFLFLHLPSVQHHMGSSPQCEDVWGCRHHQLHVHDRQKTNESSYRSSLKTLLFYLNVSDYIK